jgi:stromal membrane-associated protein
MSSALMKEQSEKALDRNIKELQDMLKWPENKHCADCGGKHPRWASSNLKVFMCIRCSGMRAPPLLSKLACQMHSPAD